MLILLVCVTLLLSGCAGLGGSAETSLPTEESTAPTGTIDPTTPPNVEPTTPPTEKPTQPVEHLVAPNHLYPFVLTSAKEDMFEEAWGTYEKKEGYLYVKNRDTNEIIQISDEPVYPVIFDTTEFIYCITEDNQLIQADYTGELWRVLYEAQYGDLASIKYRTEKLYYIDGEYVCLYDLSQKTAVPLRLVPGITRIIPCADGTLVLRNKNKEYFAYDYRSNSFRAVLDEYELNALISGKGNSAATE